jgi:ribose transport system substrate-binding protein
MMDRMPGRRRLGVWKLALAAGLVAAVAGCGSTSSTSSSASAGSGGVGTTTAAAAANTAAAQQLLAKYEKLPSFVAPGPAFDAVKAMKGKKVMGICVADQIPLCQIIEKQQATEAARLGFTFTPWQNQGNQSQWIQGMSMAAAQKYAVIDLLGIDPKLVAPQIAQARAAGVKVISSHLAGFGTPVPSTVDGAVRLPYYTVGKILAAWSIVQNKGNVNALAIVADDLESSADVIKGLNDEFHSACKSCRLTTANVPSTQWTSGVQGQVSSGLQRDPTINYVIPIYDAMTQFAVAGLQVAGKAGTVPIDTFNGTPFALKLVKSGQIAMDLGENEAWIGDAILDADMRAAAGMPVPSNDYSGAPLLIFTKDNVATAGNPPNPVDGYGQTWQTGFDKLWGLK